MDNFTRQHTRPREREAFEPNHCVNSLKHSEMAIYRGQAKINSFMLSLYKLPCGVCGFCIAMLFSAFFFPPLPVLVLEARGGWFASFLVMFAVSTKQQPQKTSNHKNHSCSREVFIVYPLELQVLPEWFERWLVRPNKLSMTKL